MLKALIALSLIVVTDPHPAALVGNYDGGQMEMAAGLSLRADGRFAYGLSYGALDEQATGTWTANDKAVLLTSDPVKPPRFVVTGQKTAGSGTLHIVLAVPGGMERQLFDAHVLLADGGAIDRQMGEEGVSIRFDAANPPVGVTLSFDLFDLKSDPVTPDPAKGYDIAFRFEPNDLGKVDFRAAPLKRDGGDLLLDRYERTIRFRRVTP